MDSEDSSENNSEYMDLYTRFANLNLLDNDSEAGQMILEEKQAIKPEPQRESERVTLYYGVSLPMEIREKFGDGDSAILVFTSKGDALDVIKQYSGARFKEFKSFQEAREFSSLPPATTATYVPTFTSVSEERLNTYKSVTSQEIVKLRKTIEKGDKEKFLELVWSNPRYLINHSDGPVICQEGSRYNALHVAAKFRQTEICQAILQTISDFEFLTLLYPEDFLLETRRKYVLDMYLNMPEKSLSETPLHFASKFGASEIVKLLLTYRECERHKENKYGMSAERIACERSLAHVDGLKKKIVAMFEDVLYVPVLRDLGNIKEPFIGKPCTSTVMMEAISENPYAGCSLSSTEPVLAYLAFAGPMPFSEASHFYNSWKKKGSVENYSSEQQELIKNICMSDSVKGLERVGRILAKDFKVDWKEFWKALGAWCDLSSSEGLQMLENHLKGIGIPVKNISPYGEKEIAECLTAVSATSRAEEDELNPQSSAHSSDEEKEESFYTPPESPEFFDIAGKGTYTEFQCDETFVNGFSFSEEDIDMYRAIEKTAIDKNVYPYVFKWKFVVEARLRSCLNPTSVVSCTPPLSSAALHRALKSGSVTRRLLF